ncbi:F-box protein At1g47056-like [Curcuma longa]|uniref:F-box protein At1g47056-like n=1 Tax=Curcuma longa TaxID=136217 RepID=UPI003D9EDC43
MGQAASSRPFTLSQSRDVTADLPDECLALVFHFLPAADRRTCSLVCRRWLLVDGRFRTRLSLRASASLLQAAPDLFSRFEAVSNLALRCSRRSASIGDDALALIASRCSNLLSLKLRACRDLTDAGMAAVAHHCPGLRKLSVGSCCFGAKGIDVVLQGCLLLEELSIKRLRGLHDLAAISAPASGATSLRSVCLEDLYNGQCFAPLIASSPYLKTLKLVCCSGDWDPLLEAMAGKVPGLAELHLERLQVSDRGLIPLSARVDLEVLRLVKTPECTDVGLVAVAESCPRLRKLHVDGWKADRISDEGLATVAQRCAGLQELVLIGVNTSIRSLELLATNCGALERLALCGCETVGDAEIACIAAKCASLKKLCIKECPVSDQCMEYLATGCPMLVEVRMKRCAGVTPECAERLMERRRGRLSLNLEAVEGEADDKQGRLAAVEEVIVKENNNGGGIPTICKRRLAATRMRTGLIAATRNMVALAAGKWSPQGGSNSTLSQRQARQRR